MNRRWEKRELVFNRFISLPVDVKRELCKTCACQFFGYAQRKGGIADRFFQLFEELVEAAESAKGGQQ